MTTTRCRILGGLLLAALLLAIPIAGRAADDLDPLLRILIKKGVITEEEARQVQEEAAALKAKETLQLTDEVKKQVAPATAPEAKPAVPIKFEMGKGVTFGKPGEHSLNLTGYIQARYDQADSGAAYSFFPTARDKDEDSFMIRRARVKFSGTAFQGFEYELQLDAAQSQIIKDARITVNRWDNAFRINMGQYKTPFSREELTSDPTLEYVERSIVDSFTPARDIGLMLDGRVAKGKFYYGAGAFNGAGENTLNDSNSLLYVARVAFDPLGEMKLAGGDIARSKEARVSIAFDYATSHDATDRFPRTIKGEKDMWGADFAWKWKGFALEAEWLESRYDPDDPATDPFDMTGWRLQAGYLIHSHLGIAARYADVSGDENPYFAENRGGTPAFKPLLDRITTATLGLTWYLKGDANKITFDYSWIDEDYVDPDVDDLDDNVFRVQYQILF